MSLTDLTIKTLKPKDKLYRKADSGGLCIEVTPTGNKLWRLRYNHNGKAQMHAIGKYVKPPKVGPVSKLQLRG